MYANAAYDWLTYNMASATVTTDRVMVNNVMSSYIPGIDDKPHQYTSVI